MSGLLPAEPDEPDRTGCLWWAIEDLNLGPLACEASALTTELIAQIGSAFNCNVRVGQR